MNNNTQKKRIVIENNLYVDNENEENRIGHDSRDVHDKLDTSIHDDERRILRVSDFCRGRISSHSRVKCTQMENFYDHHLDERRSNRENNTELGIIDDSDSEDENYKSEDLDDWGDVDEDGCPVHVSIISSSVSIDDSSESSDSNNDEDDEISTDHEGNKSTSKERNCPQIDGLTCYASSTKLLYQAGIIAGSWAFLKAKTIEIKNTNKQNCKSRSNNKIHEDCSHRHHPKNHEDDEDAFGTTTVQGLVVRIMLLPSRNQLTSSSHRLDRNCVYDKDDENFRLYITPLIAINLGWIDLFNDYDDDIGDDDNKSSSPIATIARTRCSSETRTTIVTTLHRLQKRSDYTLHIPSLNFPTSIEEAYVTLRILAKPILDDDGETVKRDEDLDGQKDAIPSLDKTMDAWPLPPPGTVLQLGKVIMIQNQMQQQHNLSHKSPPTKAFPWENTNNNYHRNHCNHYYYQVVEIKYHHSHRRTLNDSNRDFLPSLLKIRYCHDRACFCCCARKHISIVMISTTRTRFRLEAPSMHYTTRLPPLLRHCSNTHWLHSLLSPVVLNNYAHPNFPATEVTAAATTQSNLIVNSSTSSQVFHHDQLHHPQQHPDAYYEIMNQFNMQQRFLVHENQQYRLKRISPVAIAKTKLTDIRIWHAIGTERNQLMEHSIQQASHDAGRNCIFVHGLAAYAYLNDQKLQLRQQSQQLKLQEQKSKDQNNLSQALSSFSTHQTSTMPYNNSNDKDKTNNDFDATTIQSNKTRTGSFLDKMDGLRAALEDASYHSPCVLVLMDMDDEFVAPTINGGSTNDENQTIDELDRFWNILDNFISTMERNYQKLIIPQKKKPNTEIEISTNDDGIDVSCSTWRASDEDMFCNSCVPSLTIIFNTLSETSANGNKILFRYIQQRCSTTIRGAHLSIKYIQHLWWRFQMQILIKQTQCQQNSQVKEKKRSINVGKISYCLLPNELVRESIHGRPAFEIVRLLQFLCNSLFIQAPCENHSKMSILHNGLMSMDRDDLTDYFSSLTFDHSRLVILCQQYDDEQKLRQAQNGSSTIATRSVIPTTKWDDVGGLQHVRNEIMDAIELPLQYPQHFVDGGTTTGILLYGPPGTGKTLVAKAVATECGLPFLSVKGPELLGSYVGESEANVRSTFAQARQLARQQSRRKASVLFFDELDSLAPRRGDTGSGGNVMDRVVATLFAELDQHDYHRTDYEYGDYCDDKNGPNSNTGGSATKIPASQKGYLGNKNDEKKDSVRIFCIGATNRPDLLDPALLRPGRLDRLIYLGLSPSDHGKILMAQIRNLKLDERSGNPQNIVDALVPHLPPNVTGADLSTIASGALIRATERLCRIADDELEHRRQRLIQQQQQQQQLQDCDENQLKNDTLTSSSSRAAFTEPINIDQVLESWDEVQLTPVVNLDDLLFAAKSIVPSVSVAELQKYEQMSHQFKMAD